MRLPGVGGVLYMVQLQREISGFFPSYIARPRFGLQGLGFEGCGRSGLQAYQLHVLAKCGINQVLKSKGGGTVFESQALR